jgi:hypothetical protein
MNSRVLIVLLVVLVLLIALGIGVGASNSNASSRGSQPDWVQTLMRAFVHTKQLPIQDVQDSSPAGCLASGSRLVVLTPGQTIGYQGSQIIVPNNCSGVQTTTSNW